MRGEPFNVAGSDVENVNRYPSRSNMIVFPSVEGNLMSSSVYFVKLAGSVLPIQVILEYRLRVPVALSLM